MAFGGVFLDHKKLNVCIFSAVDLFYCLIILHALVSAPVQMGISPSVLRTFHPIRCAAAKYVKTVQILNYKKALLRISEAQTGESLRRNGLLCTQTSCISRQRGLL